MEQDQRFAPGTLVDIYDHSFGQWRGEYVVIAMPSDERGLYKVRNTRTNSQQFIRGKLLRISRLGPFRIESLYDKK